MRGTFRSTLANSPIDALRMLQRDGSVLDGDERARLAKEAIQGLRSRVETLDPWQAVSMVREAQQTSCSEAAAGLAELLRAAESRCLSTATTEIARELKRRQWDKARKLVADRLQQFDSMTSKREQLVRAADCAQEADRLDRLLFALQHFGPDGVRAWQRVPISRLPAEMQGLAKALRGLAVIRGEIAAPWTKPPDLAELRHSFKELRDGGWDAEAIDSLQFDVSARAFDHGHGTAGYGLLQHVVDHITPEQADIQLRDMKRHALEPQEPASGGATTRGPPSVAAFIPHGRAADVRPGVPGRSYATPLEGGMSAKWQRLIRLLLTARQGVQERIDRLTDPALMKALAQLFTRTSTASPPTANGPNTTSTAASAAGAGGGDPPHVLPLLVLPVPLEDDDREKREVLSQMIARLGRPLASPEQFLVSRLYREGETEEAIRAVLSAK